ncbi:hypothetical protein [Apilactobacillus kunkeei]|uniref:hypothetical protein n=1 Tax=Apilactobacillus kunkeei TaxID=148814 RepID=UPI00200A7AC1|nr:hypothetical protein [Apilactobacillus kunkeei]MCK8626598.1 hypothetical protein [Apilactobacillus kunkeei]
MATKIRTDGLWYGYQTDVNITGSSYSLDIHDVGNIQYEINSNDKSTPARSKVTLFNVSTDKINQIKKGDHITVNSGPSDLYGIIGEGNIIKIETNNDNGKDRTVVITFTESTSLADKTLNANFNGVSTVKHKSKTKGTTTKLNMAFKNPIKASLLIKRIAKASGISLYHVKLAKDKVYKRGYTVSNKPYSALVKIAKDCQSQIYQRRGRLVIDDYSTDNPFAEHIYFELGSGLLSEPSTYDKYGNKQCYIIECFDDPRVQAGSSIEVSSKTINGLHRVQSVKHTHQGNYDMEVVIYE